MTRGFLRTAYQEGGAHGGGRYTQRGAPPRGTRPGRDSARASHAETVHDTLPGLDRYISDIIFSIVNFIYYY